MNDTAHRKNRGIVNEFRATDNVICWFQSDEVKPCATPLQFNLHGSLLVQQLVKFADPSLVVASVLAMLPSDLLAMACNPIGSHVVDAFITSHSVGQKSRDRFYGKLQVNRDCLRYRDCLNVIIWSVFILKAVVLVTVVYWYKIFFTFFIIFP